MVLTVTNSSTTMDLTSLIAQNGLTVSRVDKASAVDTMDGKTHRAVIATKAKITLKLMPSGSADYESIMALFDENDLTVEYTDPVYGLRYATMYVEERSGALVVHYADGTEYWDPVSITLVEA
jgi:hypothetical protein